MWRVLVLAFFKIFENAVALVSTNCCRLLVAAQRIQESSAYLELAQIGPELLETFLQCDEAGGYLGGSGISRLHHSLLVEECLEPEFELFMSKYR